MSPISWLKSTNYYTITNISLKVQWWKDMEEEIKAFSGYAIPISEVDTCALVWNKCLATFENRIYLCLVFEGYYLMIQHYLF